MRVCMCVYTSWVHIYIHIHTSKSRARIFLFAVEGGKKTETGDDEGEKSQNGTECLFFIARRHSLTFVNL
jgi:hypothetical protein